MKREIKSINERFKIEDNCLKNKLILSKKIQYEISKTYILLINLNTCITEIAKILINKGFNIYLYDKEKISEKDITNNILLEKEDLGKSRLNIIYNKLIPLNATVSIHIVSNFNNLRDLKYVILGFKDYNTLRNYEEYFTRRNIYFYCINNSGILGFYYNNLSISSKNGDKIVIVDNNLFLKKSEKFFNDLKTNKKKPDKFILAIYLLELYFRKNVNKKDLIAEVKNDFLNFDKFSQKITFFEKYFSKIGCEYIFKDIEIMTFVKKFIVNFNKEFNPLSSLISEKVTNEIYNYITKKSIPKIGIITYDSDVESFDYNNFLD